MVDLTNDLIEDLRLEMMSWAQDLQDFLLNYATQPSPDSSKVKLEIKSIWKGLTSNHRAYNENVYKQIDGYRHKLYATVPDTQSFTLRAA